MLKTWNWNEFGNLHQKKDALSVQLQTLETQLQQGWDETIRASWKNTRRDLTQVENWENELLCHQARMEWTNNGDHNSKFYHSVIKERRKSQEIQLARVDGSLTSDPREIGPMAQEFYSDLFFATPYYLDNQLFTNYNRTIMDADDQEFYREPDYTEIWGAIQEMNPASSPGGDGFTGYFYRACWDVIKVDICAFIIDFFKGAYIPQEVGSITLVPIRETNEPRQLGDFRPISLGNFSRKIISKILAIRLAKLLPKLVDEEQAGFVQGRLISTHISLAQELVRV